MSRRLLAALLLAVGLLAVAVKWQTAREESGQFDVGRRLMEGVEFDRVVGMRISNVQRGSDMGLQRNAAGAWYLVDPVAYRADMGLMRLLEQGIQSNFALSAPNPDAELSLLGLDPPRVEWVVTERVGGEDRTHRMLIGDADPSGSRVYVLQEGELLLTSRALANTLERDFQDYRSRRISEIDAAHVIEVHRTGRIQHAVDEEPYDLELSAWREGAVWRALRPYDCALDPLDVGLVVVGGGRLSFEQYIEEPAVDLGEYGLARPDLRLELKGTGGASEVLLLGRPSIGGAWFCRREGAPHIYRVSGRDGVMLTYPVEAMLDRRLTRVALDGVQALRLEQPGRTVRLARAGEGWTVADGSDKPLPAEAFVVRELLAWIAEAELLPFEGEVLREEPKGMDRKLILELEGVELGGTLGGVTGEREELVWYHRFGDELIGRLDAGILEWMDRPAEQWWSLSLLELDELSVSGLLLARGGAERRFVRGERGRWRDEQGRESVELLAWLDPLLFLRATERVGAGGASDLEAPIEVSFELDSGERRTFSLGPAQGGGTECEIGPVRAILLRGDLYDGLSSLLP